MTIVSNIEPTHQSEHAEKRHADERDCAYTKSTSAPQTNHNSNKHILNKQPKLNQHQT